MFKKPLIILGAFLFLHAVQLKAQPAEPAILPEQVTAWVNSPAYFENIAATFGRARQDLEERLKTREEGVRYAVVFDIDETSLSNLEYENHYRLTFSFKTWDEWIRQARAVPIPSALEFYRWVKTQGLHPFFITGRKQLNPDLNSDPTILNLKQAGFTDFSGIYFRPPAPKGQRVPVRVFKSEARCRIEHAGYRILAVLGDQRSDLEGECLGERTYKIFNPMYTVE